jgi:hypothetical protein
LPDVLPKELSCRSLGGLEAVERIGEFLACRLGGQPPAYQVKVTLALREHVR